MRQTRRQFAIRSFALAGLGAANASPAQFPEWKTGKIAVPGGNILWRAYGGGPGAPLLMVHGGPSGADSKAWATMSALGDERRLVTWDQLDCGESDHPNDPANWRYARYVEEMEVVRSKLVPGPVHVIGASWGSTLAMEWLVTKRPANVRSVVFICPSLDSARTEASRRNAQMKLSADSKAAFDELARTGNFSNPALAAANAEFVQTFVTRNPPPGLSGSGRPNPVMMRAMSVDWRNWSRVAELSNLTQPLLLIRGEHDYITDEDITFYAAARPGSEVAVIPKAAHLAFLDNPERTIMIVRRFLNKAEQ